MIRCHKITGCRGSITTSRIGPWATATGRWRSAARSRWPAPYFSRHFPIGQAASDQPRDLILTSRQAISTHLCFLMSLELASPRRSG
jgi:hypothetical protein